MNTQYAAGFFDGEGCVHIARNIRAIISGCFRPGLLEQFSEEWGGNILAYRERSANCRQGVRWEITGVRAAKFLRDIEPFTFEKKDHIAVALEYHSYKETLGIRGGKGYSAEQRTHFQEIENRLRSIRRPHHVYSWMS